ncbi:hypothetical protein EKO27_g11734 [Xylaria grammica]|uniref:Methyltransferase domain-containing protein n=1 Tax=Xylaria grammica TaxID=363999 RepID=A0A439CMI5_9PEZI|nr:hypothetical protein EKO27_g11734 [Xylaria grammica]
MSSAPDYLMTRDYVDNNRINLQHFLCREMFGYLTHPSIPLTGPALRVADVGTGTGIWLRDLASQLPKNTRLDGLDVSFDAMPPKPLLPANTSLYHWNTREAVPEEVVGVYDLVHIRHFLFVLRDHEIRGAVANLSKRLITCGYLQWTEPDMASFRVEKGVSGDESERLVELMKLRDISDARLVPTWVPKLPEQLRAGGFCEVEYDVPEERPDLEFVMHECNLGLSGMITHNTQNKEAEQRVSGLMPKICRAARDGAYFALTRWSVVGRKPLAG